jgi:hypothetical protein
MPHKFWNLNDETVNYVIRLPEDKILRVVRNYCVGN